MKSIPLKISNIQRIVQEVIIKWYGSIDLFL